VANLLEELLALWRALRRLSVVCPDAASAERVLGQLKATVRANYSTPPMHGAQVIAQVLDEPELLAMWTAETTAMRERIRHMREQLHRRWRRASRAGAASTTC
jgi:aspartate/tyrosine/aromatic aminotransferase